MARADGHLSEVPWQSLPVIADSKPRHLITLVDSAMGLLERRPSSADDSARRLLLLGDVDYGRPTDSRPATEILQPLHGTSIELGAIKAIAQKRGLSAVELTGAGATKTAIVNALPASIVHLATPACFGRRVSGRGRWRSVRGSFWLQSFVVKRRPLQPRAPIVVVRPRNRCSSGRRC